LVPEIEKEILGFERLLLAAAADIFLAPLCSEFSDQIYKQN
jgi:hypothetical protein